MEIEQHEYWAKEILKALIDRVEKFEGGDKFITYGDLAGQINYPGIHTGSNFGRLIGLTLGCLGHLIEEVEIDGQKPPLIQAMVVGSGNKLPSDGLKEFNASYPQLSNEKKRDFAYREFQKIFDYGTRWRIVLDRLGVELPNAEQAKTKPKKAKLYNPWGSEGSPEHRELRDYVAAHPESVGVSVLAEGLTEYPLKSGDSVDVVFLTEEETVAVEVKSERSGNDDIERGIYQCIKYSAVIESEGVVKKSASIVNAKLVIKGSLSAKNKKTAKALNVQVYENFKLIK